MTMQFDWTEEKLALLKQLLEQGHSGGMIAKQLGTSRNSVIGKVHRNQKRFGIGLGGVLSKQEKCSNATARQKKRQTTDSVLQGIARKKASHGPAPVPVKVTPTIDENLFNADALRLTLVELGARNCRWEVADPKVGEDYLFCGKQTDEGRSYCEHHRLRSIGRGTESERSASRIAVRLGRVA